MDINSYDPANVSESIQNVFTNENFYRAFISKLGEKYTISDILYILESCQRGKENEWILNIDNILRDIEDSDEMEIFCMEMEDLKDSIRQYMITISMIPSLFYCFIYTLTFSLEILRYTGIDKIPPVSESRYDPWKENTSHSFTSKILSRIYLSIITGMSMTFTSNMRNILSMKSMVPVEWNIQPDILVQTSDGLFKYDIPALYEYNDYLQSKGVFDIESNSCCII